MRPYIANYARNCSLVFSNEGEIAARRGKGLGRRGCYFVSVRLSCLLHARNDERCIGRSLESLRVCDEIVVVLHESRDQSRSIALEYGANVIVADPGKCWQDYAARCKHDWILCLRPDETVSEVLEVELYLWKEAESAEFAGYRIAFREETPAGWQSRPAELRLVNRRKVSWSSELPASVSAIDSFSGELQRLRI